MKKHAIKYIASQIVLLRAQLKELECKYMRPDCSFSDATKEVEYINIGKLESELQLLCCNTFGSAEYLQECITEYT